MKPTKIAKFFLFFSFIFPFSQGLLASTSTVDKTSTGGAGRVPEIKFLHILHDIDRCRVPEHDDFRELENRIWTLFERETRQGRKGVRTQHKLYSHAAIESLVQPNFLTEASSYGVEAIHNTRESSSPLHLIKYHLNTLSDMCPNLEEHVFILMGFSRSSHFLEASLNKMKRQGAEVYFLDVSYTPEESLVFRSSPESCFLWPTLRPAINPRLREKIPAQHAAAVEATAQTEAFEVIYGSIAKQVGEEGEETLVLVERTTYTITKIKKANLDHPYHWFDRLPVYDLSQHKETSYPASWRQTNISGKISDIRLAGTIKRIIKRERSSFGFIEHHLYPKNLYFKISGIDNHNFKPEHFDLPTGLKVYFRVHTNHENLIDKVLSAGRVFIDPKELQTITSKQGKQKSPARAAASAPESRWDRNSKWSSSGSGGGGWD